jgi:HK97 family phage major capsid protein
MGEWVKQQVKDSSGNARMAWVNNLSAFIGLTVASEYSAWAITGVTTSSTQDVTDARGAELLKAIPVAARTNLRWFMNRTALYTLQKSRSAVGQWVAEGGGGPAFAPTPTELAGIPIVLTDSITDTETNS